MKEIRVALTEEKILGTSHLRAMILITQRSHVKLTINIIITPKHNLRLIIAYRLQNIKLLGDIHFCYNMKKTRIREQLEPKQDTKIESVDIIYMVSLEYNVMYIESR